MSTYSIQEKVSSESTKTKLGVAGLVALPIAAAVYSAGSVASIEQFHRYSQTEYSQLDSPCSPGELQQNWQ